MIVFLVSNSTELLDQTTTHIKNILLSIRLNNSKMNYVLRLCATKYVYTLLYIKVIYVNSLLRPFLKVVLYCSICLYGTKNYKAVLTPPIVLPLLPTVRIKLTTSATEGQRKLYMQGI